MVLIICRAGLEIQIYREQTCGHSGGRRGWNIYILLYAFLIFSTTL